MQMVSSAGIRRAAGAVGLSAVVALSACGGGGGDEATPPQSTGLVPAAPTPGATLAAQASALQPLKPGASWTYAGVYSGAPGATMDYTNVVIHSSAPRGVSEVASDAFALGASELVLDFVDGNLVQVGMVDFDEDGKVDVVDPVLLRSPVREGEQTVHFDRRSLTSADSDSDGRKDSIDIAVYSRVIGSEVLVLGGSLGSVAAVRVDLVSKVRMVLTSGAVWPTYTTTQSLWYTPSIGVVRRRLEPSSVPGEYVIYADERLGAVSGL